VATTHKTTLSPSKLELTAERGVGGTRWVYDGARASVVAEWVLNDQSFASKRRAATTSISTRMPSSRDPTVVRTG
jgi:hypothetical protein